MTSKSKNAKTPSKNNATPAGDDWKDAEEMIQPDGYWLPEAGPLVGLLTSAFEFRQKSGRSRGKLRVVYIFKLAAPCVASVKEEGGRGEQQLEKGEICAVFDSAGLSALRELEGCMCKVTPGAIDKKTGKLELTKVLDSGNEMKLYTVQYKGTRKTLQIRKAFERAAPDADDINDADDGSRAFDEMTQAGM